MGDPPAFLAPSLASSISGTVLRLIYGAVFRLARASTAKGTGTVSNSDAQAGQTGGTGRQGGPPVRKRADARRNEQTLLDAAAAVFVESGVEAPVRDIAARAGVGMGTVYRHFPTRADLVIAVYRHQVDACAEAGPALLAGGGTPYAALRQWVGLFVDFLTTKHGLAAALHADNARFETLHAYFLDRLVPACAHLLDTAVAAGEIRADVDAYGLLRGIGNLCVGDDGDPRYDARRMVDLLVAGLLVAGTA
ncbi:MAG: TetR/AcrR family transcriptional regulator [Streptomycetaceae bacterium]|nr:TetR/AcrR family transcriptional regulator [Streptomycetaceae bacterium]